MNRLVEIWLLYGAVCSAGRWILSWFHFLNPLGYFLVQGGFWASGSCRLIGNSRGKRMARFFAETPEEVVASIAPEPAASLVRTDTFFPGWMASFGGSKVPISPFPPFFSAIFLPESSKALELFLQYSPRFLSMGMRLALLGMLAFILISSKFKAAKK
jgi:hypothetical protein